MSTTNTYKSFFIAMLALLILVLNACTPKEKTIDNLTYKNYYNMVYKFDTKRKPVNPDTIYAITFKKSWGEAHSYDYEEGNKLIHQFKNLLEIKFQKPKSDVDRIFKQNILDSIDFTHLTKLKKISGVKKYTQHQINRLAKSTTIQELKFIGIDSIPQCICNNKNLKRITISVVKQMPNCLKNMDINYLFFAPKSKGGGRTYRLDIALNKILQKRFKDTTKVDYSDEVTHFRNLKPLAIKKLDTLVYKLATADSLPPNIKALKNLRYLKIDGEIRSIPEEINELTKLEVLEIEGYTYRKDNPLCRMPKSFKGLKNLKVFSMDDYVVDRFPPLYDAPNLKHILITRVVGIDSIPDSISNLKKLETFAYSEDGYKEFTDSLGFKVHKTMEQYVMGMDSLDLSDNIEKFDGYWWDGRGPNNPFYYATSKPTLTYLSPNITKLKNLTFFSLSNVRLTSLPEDIGNLTNLDHFSVTHSFLKSLPDSFTKLNPIYINLKGNQLTSLPHLKNSGKYNHATLGYTKHLPKTMRNNFKGSWKLAAKNCDFTSKKLEADPKLDKREAKANESYLEYKLFGRKNDFVKRYNLEY